MLLNQCAGTLINSTMKKINNVSNIRWQ